MSDSEEHERLQKKASLIDGWESDEEQPPAKPPMIKITHPQKTSRYSSNFFLAEKRLGEKIQTVKGEIDQRVFQLESDLLRKIDEQRPIIEKNIHKYYAETLSLSLLIYMLLKVIFAFVPPLVGSFLDPTCSTCLDSK